MHTIPHSANKFDRSKTVLTPMSATWNTASCAGPAGSVDGSVSVKFWSGPNGGLVWNCGFHGPLNRIVPSASPGGLCHGPPHGFTAMTRATSIDTGLSESYVFFGVSAW